MNWTPHVTVATVIEKDGKFLMVEESDNGRPVFNQPAGHLEEGETLFAAAVRETLEETAWHVTLSGYLGTYVYRSANNTTYIRHCFIANADKHDSSLALDQNIIAAHWLTKEEILAPDFAARSPLVIMALENYLAGTCLPLDTIQHQINT